MHCTSTLLLALLAVSLSTTLTTAHKVSWYTPTPPTRRKLEEEGCKYWEERAIEQYQTCPTGQIMCHNPNTSQNMCRLINRGLSRQCRGRSHTTTGTLGARCSSYITPAGTRKRNCGGSTMMVVWMGIRIRRIVMMSVTPVKLCVLRWIRILSTRRTDTIAFGGPNKKNDKRDATSV